MVGWEQVGPVPQAGHGKANTFQGGSSYAGISVGNGTQLTINGNTGTLNAASGSDGTGIGRNGTAATSDQTSSITINGGTITATGGSGGAGRGSTSGDTTSGNADGGKKFVASAEGVMSIDGGNIMSYSDAAHKNPGSVKIVGNNTSVKPGTAGEGKFSTSGVPADPSVSDVGGLADNEKLFSYPVYLRPQDPPPAVAETAAGKTFSFPLPEDATNIQISVTSASGVSKTWTADLSHDPFGPNLAYIWMTGEDQTLTITYDSPTGGSGTKTLDLKFYPGSGTFRTADQPVPPDAKEPGYSSDPTPPGELITPQPPAPPASRPPEPPEPPVTPDPPKSRGGIILQIGANYGEILEVPRFYFSSQALGLDHMDISTQDNALASISVLKDVINRVSTIRGEYGALQNRLERNQNDLSVDTENLTDAESRIRDTDTTEEYTKFVALSILQQADQTMAAHSNNDANRVLQLLQ